MALALAAIPSGIALASAKSNMATMAGASGDMPCKDCPDCDKPCPDMGSCLLKCFQPLTQTPASANVGGDVFKHFVPNRLSDRIAEAPRPPLLRPPSA